MRVFVTFFSIFHNWSLKKKKITRIFLRWIRTLQMETLNTKFNETEWQFRIPSACFLRMNDQWESDQLIKTRPCANGNDAKAHYVRNSNTLFFKVTIDSKVFYHSSAEVLNSAWMLWGWVLTILWRGKKF